MNSKRPSWFINPLQNWHSLSVAFLVSLPLVLLGANPSWSQGVLCVECIFGKRNELTETEKAGWNPQTWCADPAQVRSRLAAIGDIVAGDTEGDINAQLDEITKCGRAAIPGLGAALKAERLVLRQLAVVILSHIPSQAKAAIPDLATALKDENALVRDHAIITLGRMGAEAKAALPALMAMLNDEDPSVRELAALAIERIAY